MNSSDIRVWIKGTKHETELAINEHIPDAVAELAYTTVDRQESVWDIHPAHRTAVVTWFTEAPHSAPYPVGTLLFYSEAKP